MFEINFNRLLIWLSVPFLRKPRLLALLHTCCYPLMRIHNDFINNRNNNLYTLSHNSQVCSMENIFNDRFDNLARRIYITDGFTKDRIYAYTQPESKPVYLGEIPLFNNGDYADTGVDFIVWVPAAIFLTLQDLIELNALANRYRLASKRFKIYRA